MKRILVALAATGMIACCGCGDAPVQTAGGGPHLSTPPKPLPPPAGDPVEKPVKPGSEPPTQLAGPQLKSLMGNAYSQRTAPPADATNGDSPAGATLPPIATSPDSTTPTPTNTPTFPAVDPSAPTVQPPVDKSPPGTPAGGVPIGPGFTGKGQGYGNGDAGLITTPISTFFAIKEQIVLNQINEAMIYFKTNNGRNPKSEEEFMKEIIKAGSIKLPELPEGSKYQYDPASGQLMVVSPKTK